MKRRLILACLTLAPLGGLVAATSLEVAEKRLRAAVDEALSIAERAPNREVFVDRIEAVLKKHISFEVMTRRAIGPGWRSFNSAEQRQAIDLFSKLVIRSYSNKFTLGELPEIKFKSSSVTAQGRVEITTTTYYRGSRYSVIYRLEESERWQTTDVVIEGVSMVSNYRSQFDPIYRRGGAAAVLSSLEKSAARS